MAEAWEVEEVTDPSDCADCCAVEIDCCDSAPGQTIPSVLHATLTGTTGGCSCVPSSLTLVYNATNHQWEATPGASYCGNGAASTLATFGCVTIGGALFTLILTFNNGGGDTGGGGTACPDSWDPFSITILIDNTALAIKPCGAVAGTATYLITA